MKVKVKSKVYDFQKGMMAALNDPLVETLTYSTSSHARIIFNFGKSLLFLPDEGKELELVFNKLID